MYIIGILWPDLLQNAWISIFPLLFQVRDFIILLLHSTFGEADRHIVESFQEQNSKTGSIYLKHAEYILFTCAIQDRIYAVWIHWRLAESKLLLFIQQSMK